MEHVISNAETAEKLAALLLKVTAELDGSVQLVRDTCPPEEFDSYRLAIGAVLGEMLLIIMPLCRQYRYLAPPGLLESAGMEGK